jgi:nitrogen fixation protein NifX
MMIRRLRLINPDASEEKTIKERPGAMKVAFATQDLKRVDSHFGWSPNIAVYEISAEDSNLVEVFVFEPTGQDGNDDKLAPKIEAIKDCAILYVTSIGGSGAARAVQAGLHPIKLPQPEPIEDLIAKLQTVLKGNPPPWLRKALLKGKERKLDFEDEEEAVHG